ncbi:hypothetical protein [Brevundimonas sp. Root1279]|uniref:hypothetical protein n=1 Tax=Brevundimonas sp. Root1279 TaxID=1736443 RepID=UPI0006F2698E|nr:hypothetical protein [Brevundimonas sp. Root1279]KQW79720.1 hypothetical protein ASC65_14320 [Brevundimonas sp. Root1279]
MSTFNYAASVATANRLIEKFGQDGAIRREGPKTGTAYDPDDGQPQDIPARFVMVGYRSNEIDGTRVRASDKKVLMAPGSFTVEPGQEPLDPDTNTAPTTSDLLVEASGTPWNIVGVDTLRPAETTLLFTLHCRR